MNACRTVGLSLAVILCPLLAGCLVSSSNSTQESGVRVSSTTLEQIEPNRTTEQWLIATLGEPTSRTAVQSGVPTDSNAVANATAPAGPKVEILRYDFSRTERSAGAVFLIFGGATSRSEQSRAFFEVTDGVVTRAWREEGAPIANRE